MRHGVEVVEATEGEVFDIELEADILRANEKLAEENMGLLREYGVKSIDVMGSIGSGKTCLIEQLVQRLREQYKITVFNGDLTTTIDADRVKRHGVEVVQINTGKECHLDANLVKKALQKVNLTGMDLLLIENVGNLICPAEFSLGSEKRIVVTSVTEGPYMVVKHPFIFMGADVAVINKMDLADAMGVDPNKLKSDIHSINPNAKVVKTNCRTGEGVKEIIETLNL